MLRQRHECQLYGSVVVHYTHVQISRTHAVNYYDDDDDGPRGLCIRAHGSQQQFTVPHPHPIPNVISKTTCVLWSSYWIRELIAINLVGLLYMERTLDHNHQYGYIVYTRMLDEHSMYHIVNIVLYILAGRTLGETTDDYLATGGRQRYIIVIY